MEWEEEGHDLKAQCPVYFISKVLSDSKTCYPKVQKLLYAMLVTKCKLRYYFDSHLMVVMSSSGLKDIINNQESIGCITKWGLELMGLNIMYSPHTAIKSQVLADIMVEWMKEKPRPPPPS